MLTAGLVQLTAGPGNKWTYHNKKTAETVLDQNESTCRLGRMKSNNIFTTGHQLRPYAQGEYICFSDLQELCSKYDHQPSISVVQVS